MKIRIKSIPQKNSRNARKWKHGFGGNLYDDGGSYSYTKPLDNVYVDKYGNLLDPNVPSARGTVQIPDIVVTARDPRKPIPTANYLNSIESPSTQIRNTLYRRILPISDYDIKNTLSGMMDGEFEYNIRNDHKFDYEEEYPENTDYTTIGGTKAPLSVVDGIWAEYLQIPQKDRKKFVGPTIQQSKYKPSSGGKSDVNYYALPLTKGAKSLLINEGMELPIGKNKVTDTLEKYGNTVFNLGYHTIGRGMDNKGDYISYYDVFDLNPFSNKYNGTNIPLLNKLDDASFGIGKPVHIYDRIYLDNYYEMPEEYKGSSYLPEVTVIGKSEEEYGLGGNLFDDGGNKSAFVRLLEATPRFESTFQKRRNVLPEVIVTAPRRNKLIEGIENTRNIQNNVITGAVDLVTGNISKDKAQMDQKVAAKNRANKYTKIPYYDTTAELQDNLYKIGAFDGLQDRHGRDIVYKTAVDGIRGKVTDAAIERAKSMGYDVDINKGTVSKKIIPLVETEDTIPSKKVPIIYTGLSAIMNHKQRYNVQDPYVVIDKVNNIMSIMQGNKILEKHEITTSRNKGDGWYKLRGHAGLPNMPRTTGAGIFTLKGRPTSEYPRDRINKEPLFFLYAGDQNTTMAIHEPVNAERRALFNNGNRNDNRVSYGCISPRSGVVRRLYDNKVIQTGDSVYILPEIPGNYMYENNGILQMHYGINPEEFVTDTGFKGRFNYNKNKS